MRLTGAPLVLLTLAVWLWPTGPASAFCGFYVAKAGTDLFNQASKVVLTRHDGKTVITMVNDYQGALQEFAVVVPVPSVLERGQIHVTKQAIVEHLDAYTAPRLVEYADEDPCRRAFPDTAGAPVQPVREAGHAAGKALGVTVEAEYAVGEYDISILSAEQSAGLVAWLRDNGYRLPASAEPVLADYVARGMRFFLARVNLAEQSKFGYSYLRPLQIAFEADEFALPIRLGMLNAAGPQELFIVALTRSGRVETTNYPTVEIPSGLDLPLFVKAEFGDVYTALFEAQVAKAAGAAVFLEYAWDMSSCDPCAADPLAFEELRELGAFWLLEEGSSGPGHVTAADVFVTRLHLRYDAERFLQDLQFRETDDRSHFQAHYVLRRPWQGEPRCAAARDYLAALPARYEQEARNLAQLTDRPISEIRTKMEASGQSFAPRAAEPPTPKWWERIWPDNRSPAQH